MLSVPNQAHLTLTRFLPAAPGQTGDQVGEAEELSPALC